MVHIPRSDHSTLINVCGFENNKKIYKTKYTDIYYVAAQKEVSCPQYRVCQSFPLNEQEKVIRPAFLKGNYLSDLGCNVILFGQLSI